MVDHTWSWTVIQLLYVTVNSPKKAPPCFLRGTLTQNFTFFAISRPKMVGFSFCKKPLETENALYSAISLLTRPPPLLENLRDFTKWENDLDQWCAIPISESQLIAESFHFWLELESESESNIWKTPGIRIGIGIRDFGPRIGIGIRNFNFDSDSETTILIMVFTLAVYSPDELNRELSPIFVNDHRI